MINTGLLLRRPFESSYNGFRRFLIANDAQSYSRLRANLIRRVAPAHPAPSMDEMRAHWEQQYCAEYHIRHIAERPGLHERNCPECARIGYHSYLYEYPWFMVCPIHNQALISRCPDCNQPWPVPSQLIYRSCRRCGVHWGLDYLAEAVTADTSAGFEVFTPLECLLSEPGTPSRNCYLSGANGPHIDDFESMSSLHPTDVDWPSFVHSDVTNGRAAFQAVGAPLRPIVERVFNLDPRAPVWEDRSANKAIERTVIRRVQRCIRALLTECVLSEHDPNQYSRSKCGSLPVLAPQEILPVSFKIWRGLTAAKEGHRAGVDLSYFRTPLYRDPPPKPVIMANARIVTFHPNETAPFGRRCERNIYACPYGMKRWLLSVALWRQFLAIAGYILTFNAALEESCTWGDFLDRLPQDADPSHWEKSKIHIDAPMAGRLRIRALQRHAVLTRENLLDSFMLRNSHSNVRSLSERFNLHMNKCDLPRRIFKPMGEEEEKELRRQYEYQEYIEGFFRVKGWPNYS